MILQVREELEAIQQKYPDRFKLWYTVDRPKEGNDNNDIIREIFLKSVSRKKKLFEKVLYNLIFIFKGWTYGSGFVNDTMIKEHLFEPSEDNLVLMCGPPPMINFACQPNLDKLGYSPEMRFAY